MPVVLSPDVQATARLSAKCQNDNHHVGIAVDDQQRLRIITAHDDEEALAAITGTSVRGRPCLVLANLWRGIIGDHDPEEVAGYLRRARSNGRAVLNSYVTGQSMWGLDVTAWRRYGVDRMDHLRWLCIEGDRQARELRGPTAKPRRAEIDALLSELGYEPPKRQAA